MYPRQGYLAVKKKKWGTCWHTMVINKREKQSAEALLLSKRVKYKYIHILLMFSEKEQWNDKLKNQ